MRERRPVAFRIVTRILLFNGLIVFLPVVSMLLLDTYEQQLLDSLERNLVQQGRILAAALSVVPEFDEDTSEELLQALRGRHEARLRVLDASGELLADSSTVKEAPAGLTVAAGNASAGEARSESSERADTAGAPPAAEPASPPVADTPLETAAGADNAETGPRETFLYRIASFPVRLLRNVTGSPDPALPSADFYTRASYASGSEVQAALSGRYGATTRVSAGGQISVTLYSALPIERRGEIVGAVLVSQSTFRILQDIYQIRLDVFTIFLWSLVAAIVLSIFLALTIARPIAMLQRRARAVVDEHGRLTEPIPRVNRRDEIGALARSLSELTEQIDRYTRRLEGFAADASHELKNPLASISANCEMALTAKDEARRERHLNRARSDVRRAQSIISAMRELSHIDARTGPPGCCAIVTAVGAAVSDLEGRTNDHPIRFEHDGVDGAKIGLSDDRVFQIVTNLVSNAQGFAPSGTIITVRTRRSGRDSSVDLVVEDEGPGFEEPARVFDRFYTGRSDRDGHLGLGLSIVQAIAESVGGSVNVSNRDGGRGARVVVRLPVA